MPGGVMLQIGIHYTDVLEYLLGPIKAVTGRFARLVLPGDNPDVASLVLEHENGALSTLNASYASASEGYVMNIYGKEASAFYDLHQGLRFIKRGGDSPAASPARKTTPLSRSSRSSPRRCAAGASRNGRRSGDDIACGHSRRHPVGARRAPDRGGRYPGQGLSVQKLHHLGCRHRRLEHRIPARDVGLEHLGKTAPGRDPP